MSNTPTLETERLVLRRFSIRDAEAFFEIMRNREVNTFLPLFPFGTIGEAERYLTENYLKRYDSSRGFHYAISLRSINRVIGYVNVNDDESHDLGYGLGREFWGKGIATESCGAVLERVERDGLPYITATHDVDNPRSGEVMKRIGMTYRYSYQERWQPKNLLVTFRMYQLNFDGRAERVYRGYWQKYPVHFVEDGV